VLAGNGPMQPRPWRRGARRMNGAWVREAALAYAKSGKQRQPRKRRNREITMGHAEHAALGSLHSQPQRACHKTCRLAWHAPDTLALQAAATSNTAAARGSDLGVPSEEIYGVPIRRKGHDVRARGIKIYGTELL